MGVLLSKDLMAIAGHSLKANITTLGPMVLPISEQLLFFLNLIARKVHTSAYTPKIGIVLRGACGACRSHILTGLCTVCFRASDE